MKVGRTVVASAVALMLVVGGAGPAASVPAAPTPAGDVAAVPMSKAQAARVYRSATCPMNLATDVVLQGLEDKVDWATLRPLILTMARAQLRVSRVLNTPPRPWPAKVQPHVLVIGALMSVQSGMNYVLAGADSLEEYQRLVDELSKDPAPALMRLLKDFRDAVNGMNRYLDLPADYSCEGFA